MVNHSFHNFTLCRKLRYMCCTVHNHSSGQACSLKRDGHVNFFSAVWTFPSTTRTSPACILTGCDWGALPLEAVACVLTAHRPALFVSRSQAAAWLYPVLSWPKQEQYKEVLGHVLADARLQQVGQATQLLLHQIAADNWIVQHCRHTHSP